MSDTVVFAGPSIPIEAAVSIALFDFRPPAAQGDVTRAVWEGAGAIGLIDGYFESVPAVWHKEILFALSRGVHVFGAASMGALRAAELDTFGMRGVGRIYGWYAAQTIDADDEVALVHGPSETGFVALSEPLVNVRATLESAVSAAQVDNAVAEHVLSAARRLFYKHRTWPRILAEAALPASEDERLSLWLTRNRVDQKRLDAGAMLHAMAEFLEPRPGPFEPGFAFEHTDAWDLAVESLRDASTLSDIDALVLDEARLDPEAFRQLVATAALGTVSPRDPPPAPVKWSSSRRVDALRIERGLHTRKDYTAWLQENRMSEADLVKLLAARESTGEWLHASRDALLRELIGEIKLRGLYGPLAARGARKAGALASEANRASARRRLPSAMLVFEWFFEERLGRRAPESIDDICRDLLLPDQRALHELLAQEFLFATLDS